MAGWSTVILFAVLLTFIFSFLGAFFCAALTGMMLGSFKLPRWQPVVLSCIFPSVLFTVLRSAGSELLLKQVALLSLLCLVTFWVTYFVVRGVVWYERKGQFATPAASGEAVRSLGAANANGTVTGELNLHVLQGKWSCAIPNHHSPDELKHLEIQRDNLLLTIRDAAGRVSFRGRGELELRAGPVVPLVSISRRFPESDDTLVCI